MMNRLMSRSNEPTGRRWGWAKNDYRMGVVSTTRKRSLGAALLTAQFISAATMARIASRHRQPANSRARVGNTRLIAFHL